MASVPVKPVRTRKVQYRNEIFGKVRQLRSEVTVQVELVLFDGHSPPPAAGQLNQHVAFILGYFTFREMGHLVDLPSRVHQWDRSGADGNGNRRQT